MSIKSGFYNSFNHDRKYNAEDFGRIFDGLIKDGIYMGFGDAFRVSPYDSESMKIQVGTGRAWFNHTWMVSENPTILTIDRAEIAMKRIDSIIIEVNKTTEIRNSSIVIVKGTPSANPTPPTIEHTSDIKRYVLANISIKENVTKITASDIENMIGRDSTPYVTGIIQTINIDRLVEQWNSQWDDFKRSETEEINAWQNTAKSQIDTWGRDLVNYSENKKATIDDWYNTNTREMLTYMVNKKSELDTWVAGIKNVLNEEAIVKLTAMYNEMVKKIDDLTRNTTTKIDDFKLENGRKLSEFSNEVLEYIQSRDTKINTHIEFRDDGSIVTTNSKFEKTVVFNDDGTITTTYKYKYGNTNPINIKTIFNDDGSIDIRRI